MSSKSKACKRAAAYAKRWGAPRLDGKIRREDYEMEAIEQCRQGHDPADFKFSCSETITLILGLGRHDLLPEPYGDPVEAWSRLNERQRAVVRAAIGEAPWMIGNTRY